MTQRLVTLDNLGAWLLKCNADASDIEQRSRRDPRVAQWCVQPNYRTRLMRKGHKVIFWVSGSRRTLRPGIWGVGHLVGAPHGQDEEPPAGPAGGRWQVPLDVVMLDEAHRVPRERLRADERLADLEVFRQPQSSNPSFVTAEQLAAVEDHVRWPRAAVGLQRAIASGHRAEP